MTRNSKAIITLSVIYMVLVCAFMISHRLWFSPDQFFIFALFGSLILGRARMFVLDWGPFLFLFFGYEFLRGDLVPFMTKNVNIFPMIQADQKIFGFIPTIRFQTMFYNPTHLQWYDYLLVTLYICHFVTPMIIGFIFWLKDRALFKQYALSLLVLSYAGFLTFILFPAMPPWMASSEGYLPPIKEVTGEVMSHFFTTPFAVPTIYSMIRSNPVAAMPSLHAAFPFLIFLFLIKKYKKWGLLFLPYVLGVNFAVLYLGEHYFVDVVAGVIYATATFFAIENNEFLLKRLEFFIKPLRNILQPLVQPVSSSLNFKKLLFKPEQE